MSNKSKRKDQERKIRPAQTQSHQPGRETKMKPAPQFENKDFKGSGRLKGRVALVTGGDSGIGRAVALAFAREGADVAIVYLEEESDARFTAALVEKKGRRCLAIPCDIARKAKCEKAVATVIRKLGRLDILVNNAAEQHPQPSITDITEEQLVKTFRTNIFSMFFLTAAALPSLEKSGHAAIINTTSVTAYRGSPALLDYSATKGAIVSFTRSLATQLAKTKIRVNGVAPGPIWTPLIPATFPPQEVATFGSDSPLGRAGEPWECAECFVFLASEASSYMTGQILHPNGGEIING
jgi:NAD(P)-dependent dehydrogenase (short-subunit alcohol dehydrogenase family)